MQFGYTILYVEDVPQTIAFYEAAFGLTRRFVHEAGDYGELDTGATALAFSSLRLMTELGKNPQRATARAPSFEIAFTTADVAAAVQRAVAAGARLVQAPEQMPWGQTVAYVADINDALVELCTTVAPPPATAG
ncbi:VOC family protein [Acidovorax sp. Leaf78]|uniref:VOC family protein n=1 Tax=Acidovorax sp. Leaf78 TaxID=1736237 RepID=UPI0006FE50E2|nr:VOC family protein [Acidovorax sp. Leaf78]KQO23338.1 glyoxalase [Acidovorax sp. Leaf78]